MAEMFDVYDERGNWTGTAERKEVHAKGLWHHTVHCWLVRRDEKVPDRAKVLFQQRSESKDTNPGCFDITAAGHLEAGESPEAVVRELEEELGVRVAFEELAEFGIIREQESGVVHGVPYIDAEVSHVYGLVTSLSMADFRLQEEEVSGIYEADVEELISLMEESVKEITAHGLELREGKLQDSVKKITRSSFVSRDYGTYISIFRFLRELVKL
ncbi:NUDIX hydrolase [Cohnella luojiensis]|uniref:NUDIX domain-containing protein n=1 Tax=Cohnella luojiensis TaxID=652876 RepID=A0A4Y8LQY8_9BACL|nr:NUDIX domain-containing protein [Cohnella luojiensis]TFE23676.1 NUDIX domain-containing protein [Cohnella luojiensis]